MLKGSLPAIKMEMVVIFVSESDWILQCCYIGQQVGSVMFMKVLMHYLTKIAQQIAQQTS